MSTQTWLIACLIGVKDVLRIFLRFTEVNGACNRTRNVFLIKIQLGSHGCIVDLVCAK